MSSKLLRLGLLTALLATGSSAPAQTYSIDWHTIDGGGGTSEGGSYSITGTIGQPDASAVTMKGGPYALKGGFWSLIAVLQAPGAPRLAISFLDGDTAVLSWPSSAGSWQIQQSSNPTHGPWTPVPGSVASDGATKSITVTLSSGKLFFRLAKP